MSELLAPAGNIEALDAAIGEGADAVYMGLKSFNARLRSSNFAWNQFEAAVQAVHRQKKKIYVTENKEYLGELLNTSKLATETIKQFTVSIQSKNGTTAEIVVEGIYDTSKKWYEQPSGSFRGENENSDYNGNSCTISHILTKLLIVNYEYYYIESIDDSTIKTEEFDENGKQISFTYTTVGTGKDTVVTIDLGNGETLDITWNPDNVFNCLSFY